MCRDYIKYAEQLRTQYADVIVAKGTSEPAGPSGRIYVMGQGDMGQLGLGEDETEKLRPGALSIEGGLRVLQVACGGMHTLALVEGGLVYSWGVNDEGALGREARGGHLALQEGETAGDETVPEKIVFPGGVKIKSVTAGDSHSMALTQGGAVYGWGMFRDSGGKFGFSPDTQIQTTPALVKVGGEKIQQLVSGSDHVLALTPNGSVWSWGCAECGRLGRVEEASCDQKTTKMDKTIWKSQLLTPGVVPGLPKASYVACGLYCSFAVAGGEFYGESFVAFG